MIHPDHLMGQLSSREFDEWMAYYGLEPFGELRGDLQAGIVASTMVNMLSGKDAKKLSPGDFVLFQQDQAEKKPRDAKELYAQFRSWAASFQQDKRM